jgi:hypothetical protein
MTRQDANLKIVKKIWQAYKDHQDWRFGQILRNLGVIREIRDPKTGAPEVWVNEFNTESVQILNSMITEEKKDDV